MIKPHKLDNPKAVESYHEDHYKKGDYYSGNKTVKGQWMGKGALELGLKGVVGREEFSALCYNQKPNEEGLLTAHSKQNRRVGWDWVAAPPKSVSIAALVGGDKRVIAAHEKAVQKAFHVLELAAARRLRGKADAGKGGDETTGNLVAAFYRHETARAVEEGASPDPDLHTHMVVFNATQAGDGQWRALQTEGMYRARSHVEAVYHFELTRELEKLGYRTEKRGKSFELAGVSKPLRERFSKRRAQVVEEASRLAGEGASKERQLGLQEEVAKSQRIRKDQSMASEQLLEDWRSQMTKEERYELQNACGKTAKPLSRSSQLKRVQEAYNVVEASLFAKAAVVKDVQVKAGVLEELLGAGVEAKMVEEEYERRDYYRGDHGRLISTATVLERERQVVEAVRSGRGKFAPLAPTGRAAESLNEWQKKAAEKVFESRDLLTVFRGSAGTGKSYTLEKVLGELKNAGTEVRVLAPGAGQVEDLKKDGLTEAETLALYLEKSIKEKRGTVLLLDEAGQVGGQDFARLIDKAKAEGLRIIASGDTRQFGPVAASDMLSAIQRFAEPETAEIPALEKTIMRQKEKWYRQAVVEADRGNTSEALKMLEKAGCVKEVGGKEQEEVVANRVVEAVRNGESALAISQTNANVKRLNHSVRERYREEGWLSEREHSVKLLEPKDLETKELRKEENYRGAVARLNRGRSKLPRGTILEFVAAESDAVRFRTPSGRRIRLKNKELEQITVYARQETPVAQGEKLLIRENTGRGDSRLTNGTIVTVESVEAEAVRVRGPKGEVALDRDTVVASYGYATTAYRSQGKSVDHVIVADAACKAASSAREFYVSISRGKKGITLVTPDAAELKEHVSQLDVPDVAMEAGLSQRVKRPARGDRLRRQVGEFWTRSAAMGRRAASAVFEPMQPAMRVVAPAAGRVLQLILEQKPEPAITTKTKEQSNER